ncbi:MAG: Uma2 family endonuclease, partial [Candidatus Bipolaricaulota bacterium]|nr:Uma2 family endonuclease [Candidatus Bipolaricaulota bacterium]MDW8127455.1 Uma2 family endonuclease [Candidatus Bipolaricaulota bacterium]
MGVLDAYAQANGLGVVVDAPFTMKLGPEGPVREPDLLFVAQENLERLKETHLEGPADLGVEIVSPESAARDQGTKFYEYEAAGVREYWLLDPDREEAEFYMLREGRYRLVYPEGRIF